MTIAAVLVAAVLSLCESSAQGIAKLDSLTASLQKPKEGWSIVPLPILSYNTDLGFQFGAYAEIYDFGKNPTLYPDYRHRFHIEASHYTKGQTLVHFEYDSEHLIPGIRMSIAASWQRDPLYSFYGFNALEGYDREADRRNGLARYNYDRTMGRFLSTFQGKIWKNLHWVGGFSVWRYETDDIDEKFGYSTTNTLYREYRNAGVIKENESQGWVGEFKGGLSWDSRDLEAMPSKGIYADISLNGSPDIFNTGYSYLKLSAHFRQYITVGWDWLVLAYHLAYQGTLAGEAPFFLQQNIYSLVLKQCYSDGLGGFNTVRGMLGAKLVSNGYAWGNFEVRIRLLQWNYFNQYWFIGINPFFDCGVNVQPYKIEEMAAMRGVSPQEILPYSQAFHPSAGIGLKIGLNQNYVCSFEWGKAFRPEDGPSSFTCSLNYIF